MVNGLDPDIKSKIRTDWQCVGKTTDDLVAELSRPQNSRSCDIVISPITIRDDRKALINFVSGVYYTYTLPLGPAIEQSDGSDISFWLRPFQTTAWLVNLGLLLVLGVIGGLLALFLTSFFPHGDSDTTGEQDKSKLRKFSELSGGSMTSIFGQHPSHGLFPEKRTSGATIAMAIYFTAAVFALAIVTMQYAGNLAAIQSQPTVIPAFDAVADLFGQKVLTSEFYGSKIGYNATIINPMISNDGDVISRIKDVDEGRADAFLWDALVVLAGVKTLDESNSDVCIYPLKKRIYPFEIGFGVGKDVPEEILTALQNSLNALDKSGELRNLRTTYLDGLTKYIGNTVCPRAVEGLTAGQIAGVYMVPAVVFAGIVLFAFTAMACRRYKNRHSKPSGTSSANQGRNAQSQFMTSSTHGGIPFGSPKTPPSTNPYPDVYPGV
ncbi:hypothetical protein Ndes2526B_g03882 [Nannochloris sp. 'desiccata']|nr:hypothetical protein NADE_006807 [Chlorella desiccata (nom. nud.)]